MTTNNDLIKAERELGTIVKVLKDLGYGKIRIKLLVDAYWTNTVRLDNEVRD